MFVPSYQRIVTNRIIDRNRSAMTCMFPFVAITMPASVAKSR